MESLSALVRLLQPTVLPSANLHKQQPILLFQLRLELNQLLTEPKQYQLDTFHLATKLQLL